MTQNIYIPGARVVSGIIITNTNTPVKLIILLILYYIIIMIITQILLSATHTAS